MWLQASIPYMYLHVGTRLILQTETNAGIAEQAAPQCHPCKRNKKKANESLERHKEDSRLVLDHITKQSRFPQLHPIVIPTCPLKSRVIPRNGCPATCTSRKNLCIRQPTRLEKKKGNRISVPARPHWP